MIAYDIACNNGHTFEGWFKDNSSFEDQRSRGLIGCPHCGSTHVARVPSTFAIGNRQKTDAQPSNSTPEPPMMLQVQRYIEKYFENVGARFADEAFKIHYGEVEKRNIRGTTTPEEEQQLKEEGVAFIKVPIIRYDS
jgi:hypothetical protein